MGSSSARIPVTVLSGFLGSGKTTLLNAALRDPRLRDTAVVVNELGTVGLDHRLVAGAAENIVLLDAGCLCCGVLNSLRETLLDLAARRACGTLPRFARVIVETTGLADPAPVLQSLLRDALVVRDYRFDGLVTTVDATLGESSLGDYVEATLQVAMADRLVVTKTDLTAGQVPTALEARLLQLNPAACAMLLQCTLDPSAALSQGAAPSSASAQGRIATRGTEPLRGDAAPVARHTPGIHSEVFTIDADVSWAGLAGWIELVREQFGARLLRCKGLVRVAGVVSPQVVQGVQGVFAAPRPLDTGAASGELSFIVCIYRDLDAAALRASLRALQAEPGTHRAARITDLLPAVLAPNLPAGAVKNEL